MDAVAALREAFEQYRDPVRAVAMAAYMRGQFPFFGIPSPERRALTRAALADWHPESEGELAQVAARLWSLPEREYQYAAIDLVARHIKLAGPTFLADAERLVTSKSWWDSADGLVGAAVGPLVANYPDLAAEMDRWVEGEDFWLVRCAILHQMRYKGGTDTGRLFGYCLKHSGDSQFFIRKAIGWALREYSKTDGETVRAFVSENAAVLSPLSQREALLWLNGGRKPKATT